MHANPHTICNGSTHTHARWGNMRSTSSQPWISHLTIRAAESMCAHVPVFVMIAMPLLPPVACYLRELVKPSGRQGCGDRPVATTVCSRGVSKWLIAARHNGRDSTSSVSSPRRQSPRPLIILHAPPLWIPRPSQTTTQLPPNARHILGSPFCHSSLPISCHQAIVLF